MAVDPGNPRRFLRSTKWKKVMDDFFHGQLVPRLLHASVDGGVPTDSHAPCVLRDKRPQ